MTSPGAWPQLRSSPRDYFQNLPAHGTTAHSGRHVRPPGVDARWSVLEGRVDQQTSGVGHNFHYPDDRRSFVKTCLERSAAAPLEVTVDVVNWTRRYPMCTCRRDGWSRLIPNGAGPCEPHSVFEPLSSSAHKPQLDRQRTVVGRSLIPCPALPLHLALPVLRRTLARPIPDGH